MRIQDKRPEEFATYKDKRDITDVSASAHFIYEYYIPKVICLSSLYTIYISSHIIENIQYQLRAYKGSEAFMNTNYVH